MAGLKCEARLRADVPAIHVLSAADIAELASFVIACDKREALAQGAKRRSNPSIPAWKDRLLRFARNDGFTTGA
jgi:hypothetical protein